MARTTVIGLTMVARPADAKPILQPRIHRPPENEMPPCVVMASRLITALGALAATAAVVGGFALLFKVLDEGGSASVPPRVIRVAVPAGREPGGRQASAGHAAVGAKLPRPTAARPATASDRSPRVPTVLRRPRRGPAFAIAHVREGARVDLESEPDGPVVAKLDGKTEFGSPLSLSVVETKPGWLGVTAPEIADDAVGWIARDPQQVALFWTRYSLHVELASRVLELRYGHQVVRRFVVTIGGPGTETPTGRYGVTDGVEFDESPYYGCCALALSGHQTAELPAGWIGGNRLAIHGTPGQVGGAESLGCIRASDETMRYLFRRVPLGAPVFIAG
jgi:lipoprotein-anchoring transpeptidase ErfK/SrfK